MPKKIRVGILFGGKSVEHEVSLQSAKNIIEAIDQDKYEVVLIGIDKQGQWHLSDSARYLLEAHNPKLIKLNQQSEPITLILRDGKGGLMTLKEKQELGPIDVVFPVLHGPFGEDGTVQGLLKLANIPFVGADVIGSAIGMDKDVTKRLLRDSGIPIAQFITILRPEMAQVTFESIVQKLGLPFFLKPANLGSSVGISKIKDREQFQIALSDAFKYDHKVLAEEYIRGREIECAVLGNEDPIASLPGEILPQHDFYSYEAKYIDEQGAVLEVPARLPDALVPKFRELAVRVFKVLCCQGMARVDFFLRNEKEILVNELNSIPGFTRISMYPKLWEISGIPYRELIDRLLQLALNRFKQDQQLKTSVDLQTD
jgi:D-alanine-D-alanine ligase